MVHTYTLLTHYLSCSKTSFLSLNNLQIKEGACLVLVKTERRKKNRTSFWSCFLLGLGYYLLNALSKSIKEVKMVGMLTERMVLDIYERFY